MRYIHEILGMAGPLRRCVPRRFRNETIEYGVGHYKIVLSHDHLLPEYQKQFRLYDRFLPVLCRQFEDRQGWIVDVGANVGDTTVAMVQVCEKPILAIEGCDAFYPLLLQNVERLSKADKRRVKTVRSLLGTGIFLGELISNGTTATRSAKTSSSANVSLDDALKGAGVQAESISLLKVDTDGYDADVLLSGPEVLENSTPILFWEKEFSSPYQVELFVKLYEALHDIGYLYFWPFDNFGNLILDECSIKEIYGLNKYLAAQELHGATRTMHNIDILATTERDAEIARAAIRSYRSEVIEI